VILVLGLALSGFAVGANIHGYHALDQSKMRKNAPLEVIRPDILHGDLLLDNFVDFGDSRVIFVCVSDSLFAHGAGFNFTRLPRTSSLTCRCFCLSNGEFQFRVIMALMGSALGSEVGLRLLLSPAASNVIVRSACTIVGVGFPIYATHQAIEKKDPVEQEMWLVYWAAYGCFSVTEMVTDKLLAWFPMYYHAKFVFLVWLQLPNNYVILRERFL
jgi:hypothetical protein